MLPGFRGLNGRILGNGVFLDRGVFVACIGPVTGALGKYSWVRLLGVGDVGLAWFRAVWGAGEHCLWVVRKVDPSHMIFAYRFDSHRGIP